MRKLRTALARLAMISIAVLVLAAAAGLGVYSSIDRGPSPATASTSCCASTFANQSESTVTDYATLSQAISSTFSVTPSFAFNVSSRGLELAVETSGTSLNAGENLSISISLRNELNRTLSLPTPQNCSKTRCWEVNGFPVAFWPGCYYQGPVEFMVVSGRLNISEMEAMSTNSSVSLQICQGELFVDHVLFNPDSTEASISGLFVSGVVQNETIGPFGLRTSFSIDGYWTYPINASEASDINSNEVIGCNPPCWTFVYPEVGPIAQDKFSPGQYTLLVTDEWNQTVLLYISVV